MSAGDTWKQGIRSPWIRMVSLAFLPPMFMLRLVRALVFYLKRRFNLILLGFCKVNQAYLFVVAEIVSNFDT